MRARAASIPMHNERAKKCSYSGCFFARSFAVLGCILSCSLQCVDDAEFPRRVRHQRRHEDEDTVSGTFSRYHQGRVLRIRNGRRWMEGDRPKKGRATCPRTNNGTFGGVCEEAWRVPLPSRRRSRKARASAVARCTTTDEKVIASDDDDERSDVRVFKETVRV